MKIKCGICPHNCALDDNEIGFCRARGNAGGQITCLNYGKVTSLSLDPIEKKPLRHFYPGGLILSAGSFGCNLRCAFCQNHSISMTGGDKAEAAHISPEELVNTALKLVPEGNIGIAYTYNEPLVGYEYIMDCSMLARERGLKNVLVTNGYICGGPFSELLPFIDAMNIDLKGFTDGFYKKLCGGLETVKETIATAAGKCHVEVTTLIIPGENDSIDEITRLSEWLASVDRNIPLHISRFFPNYKYSNKGAGEPGRIYELAQAAREHLTYVTGNC